MQDASRSLSSVLLSPSRPPAQAPHSELIFLFVCINTALTLASASPDLHPPHVRPVLPPASLSLDLFTLDLLLLFLQITLQIHRGAVLLDVSVAEDRTSPPRLDLMSRPFDLSDSKYGSKLYNGLLSRLPVLGSLVQPRSSRGTSRLAKKCVLSSGTPFLVPLRANPPPPPPLCPSLVHSSHKPQP